MDAGARRLPHGGLNHEQAGNSMSRVQCTKEVLALLARYRCTLWWCPANSEGDG